MKLLFRHSSNSRKLSRQKFHNELACVFTAHFARKNADWNQQQLEQRKSSVLFPIQSEKSPDSGIFTCDPTEKCIMPSSRERHKGIIGRGHDLRLEVSLLAPHWLPKEEYNKIMCIYTWRLIQPCFFCLVHTFWPFHSEWILRCYNSSGLFWRNFLLVFFTLGLYKKKSESVGEFSNFGHSEPGNLSKGRTPPCFWQRRFWATHVNRK